MASVYFGVIFTLFRFLNWLFAAQFSNCSNSLNFEAKINFNTTKQNELKWRKICTGLKFDLEHFNGPKGKFLRDSLYEHPVYLLVTQYPAQPLYSLTVYLRKP